jgi:hypothetical protein
MTSCWRAVSSVGTHVIASVRRSTVSSHSGGNVDPAAQSDGAPPPRGFCRTAE